MFDVAYEKFKFRVTATFVTLTFSIPKFKVMCVAVSFIMTLNISQFQGH